MGGRQGARERRGELARDFYAAIDLFVTALERRRRVQLAVVVVLSVIAAVLLVEVAENAPRDRTTTIEM